MTHPRRIFAMALSAGSLLFGCADSEQPDEKLETTEDSIKDSSEAARWVGEITDSDVKVGVVSDGVKARLFFCGGNETFSTGTRWFNDLNVDGDVAFEDSTWKVRATLGTKRVTGEVALAGEDSRPFEAEPVAAKTLAGLWEGQGECGRLGLVVTQPSTTAKIQAQGACVGDGHQPQQVNPITPIASENGKVPVDAPDGGKLLLAPATLTPL
jgi:hypothetical protein